MTKVWNWIIRRCWFQIWQESFKILAQRYPKKAIFVPNLSIFVISQYFPVRQIQGLWFQIWQNCFQIPEEKYIKKAFFMQNSGIFVFFVKFCKLTNLKVWISNLKIAFLKFLPKNNQIRDFWWKILKWSVFGSKFRHFCFFAKFYYYTNLKVLISSMTRVF